MRISDWSSDVCSSDLVRLFRRTKRKVELTQAGALFLPQALDTLRQAELALLTAQRAARGEVGPLNIATTSSLRSEERGVGKACVSPCSSRWPRDHVKNKPHTQRHYLIPKH